MSSNKNENKLCGNNPAQTTPAGAKSEPLKPTDIIRQFPDADVKRALSFSRVDEESPLYHFIGLYDIAKNYIICNQNIEEYIRENFEILTRSMDFYLHLINETHENNL